jgi:hypothetical protein
MTETWRNIPGVPARFFVSDHGRVKVDAYEYDHPLRGGGVHRRKRPYRILKEFVNVARGGYSQVTMTYTEDRVRVVMSGKVHRMVALAFIPNPLGLPEVNHKDTNKQNNHVANLEWVTKSENSKHSHRAPTRKPHGKKTPVRGTSDGDVVVFPSVLAAHNSGRFRASAISLCLAGKLKHHRGYRWEKIPLEEFVRDMHGKIQKPEGYKPPDLSGLY